jgi:hypothetical protein
MIPINNSDTAWLIVSDYNQDNGIGFPDELREDILNCNANDWDHIAIRGDGGTNVGGRGRGSGVGGISISILYVEGRFVGTMAAYDKVGGFSLGNLVGGYEHEVEYDDPD